MGHRARRFVGAVILLAWFASPAIAMLPSGDQGPHDRCTGHVCQCRSHCPPRPSGPKSCHEAAGAPRCEMTSRCHHQPAPLTADFRLDSILVAREGGEADPASSPLRVSLPVHPAAGHTRLDPRPPRSHS